MVNMDYLSAFWRWSASVRSVLIA